MENRRMEELPGCFVAMLSYIASALYCPRRVPGGSGWHGGGLTFGTEQARNTSGSFTNKYGQ